MTKRHWLLIFSVLTVISLCSFRAYSAGAGSRTVQFVKVFNAVAAGSAHTSSPVDMGLAYMGSAQCDWASLTGTVNATVQVNVSDDGGTQWNAKSSGLITLSGATGTAYLPFSQTPEQLYQLVYVAGTVTGGTVSCWVLGK